MSSSLNLPESFSPDFVRLLRNAWWRPTRQVRIDRWLMPLEQEGYVANPLATELVRSLGGLTVTVPPVELRSYTHWLIFDPVRAAAGELDRAKHWKREIGVDLFPIGQDDPYDFVIWVGSDSRLYFGRDDGLYFLGDTVREAMDQLAFPYVPFRKCAE